MIVGSNYAQIQCNYTCIRLYNTNTGIDLYKRAQEDTTGDGNHMSFVLFGGIAKWGRFSDNHIPGYDGVQDIYHFTYPAPNPLPVEHHPLFRLEQDETVMHHFRKLREYIEELECLE